MKLLNSKTTQGIIKSLLMIYDGFESNLIPENNGKQSPDDPYTKKCQNHDSCIHSF